jgi:hypothetical protein
MIQRWISLRFDGLRHPVRLCRSLQSSKAWLQAREREEARNINDYCKVRRPRIWTSDLQSGTEFNFESLSPETKLLDAK